MLYRGVRERDLRGHISHDAATPDASAAPDAQTESETPADAGSEAEADTEDEPDVLIARALEVLKSWTYFDRLSERKAGLDPASGAGARRPE